MTSPATSYAPVAMTAVSYDVHQVEPPRRLDLPRSARSCRCAAGSRSPLGCSSDRHGPAARGSGAVLLLGDVVEPGDDFTVLIGFLHGDVGHEPVWGGSVPVLLAGLDVHHVAGADLTDLAAAPCDESDAVCDVQGLALGVVVPGGASTG